MRELIQRPCIISHGLKMISRRRSD